MFSKIYCGFINICGIPLFEYLVSIHEPSTNFQLVNLGKTTKSNYYETTIFPQSTKIGTQKNKSIHSIDRLEIHVTFNGHTSSQPIAIRNIPIKTHSSIKITDCMLKKKKKTRNCIHFSMRNAQG